MIPINAKEFHCSYCEANDVEIYFTNKHNLIEHYKDKHSNLIFHCEVCDDYLDRKILLPHMIGHAGMPTPEEFSSIKSKSVSPFSGPHIAKESSCSESAIDLKCTNNTLTNNNSNNKNKLKCYACNKVFANRSSILYHTNQVHLKIKNFECAHCKKTFGTKKLLSNHISCVHSMERSYKCNSCLKFFKTDVALYTHSKIHELNALQYNCNFCDKKFRFRHHLLNHELLHRNNREYNCKLCPKKFNTKIGVSKHMPTHNTDLKYTCTQCNFAAKQKRYLVAHMKRKH